VNHASACRQIIDGLGSTANLTDGAGNLAQSYRYDAWGRVWQKVGASSNPRQYIGHYHDEETGLDYFGARYYDSEIGRFLSQDSYLGQADVPPSLHRYLYAYANPLRYVDLTGYSSEESNESSLSIDKNNSDGTIHMSRGGWTKTEAKGAASTGLAKWVNGESSTTAGEEAVVEDSGPLGYTPGDIARRVQRWQREKVQILNDWMTKDPTFIRWGLGNVAEFGLGVMSSMADSLKFGEGMAQGGWEGWISDAFRAMDLYSGISGVGRAVVRHLPNATVTTLKRVGKRYFPQALTDQIEERALAQVAGSRYIIGSRSVDPFTGHGSRKAAQQGITPKPATVKGKTGLGGVVEASEICPGLGRCKAVYRSDNDLAWVWDKKSQRFLTEGEVQEQILTPLNQMLPPNRKFMHGAHFNAFDAKNPANFHSEFMPSFMKGQDPKHLWRAFGGSGPGGTLSWSDYGKLAGNLDRSPSIMAGACSGS
jgi:RHS repeat-associated protein